MNMRGAFADTLQLAEDRGMGNPDAAPFFIGTDGCTIEHLRNMQRRITPDFSEGKLGRWLGWAQAVVVVQGFATLDDMKSINRKHA